MKRIYTPARKKTILIVDDDQVVVHAYQENFQSHGYNVKVADNEHSVMQTLRNEPIDLMIFDLCLPGMEGVEVLKNIRSEAGTQALPIIVISNAYLGNLGRLVELAVKALTWLFKESPEPVSTATAPDSAPPETGSYESHHPGPGAPGDTDDEALPLRASVARFGDAILSASQNT